MQTNAHDTFKEINAPHGVIVSVSFSTIILSLLITCKAAWTRDFYGCTTRSFRGFIWIPFICDNNIVLPRLLIFAYELPTFLFLREYSLQVIFILIPHTQTLCHLCSFQMCMCTCQSSEPLCPLTFSLSLSTALRGTLPRLSQLWVWWIQKCLHHAPLVFCWHSLGAVLLALHSGGAIDVSILHLRRKLSSKGQS